MKIRSLILTIICCLGCTVTHAGQLMLTAKLDSTSMLMGNVNHLKLEVVQDKGVRGEFPLLKNFGEKGYVTLLNDTIELGSAIKVDTAELGSNRIQINYNIPVQVFDSGYYRLPEFVYVAGRDSVKSGRLVLTVKPVPVKADDEISPLTGPADPENPSIFDHLPDWLYYYWWLILLGLLLIAGGIWAWKRYRKVGTILPPKPVTPPYELAMQRLERLKARKLWQSGQEKEFYTLLTDILRSYLDGRFGIKALEMTSRQIMEKLSEDSSLRESRQKMRQVLDMADFVKFAMARPLPDDNIKAFENALDFVKDTKPVENPVKSDDDQSADDSKTEKGGDSAAGNNKKGGDA